MPGYLNSAVEDVKYHIETQDFDGPIDLLVKMVRESKIDVMDIFISDIIAQYIDYVNKLNELDYEYISEYVRLATDLILIKSRKMNPQAERCEEPDEDDEYIDEAESRILEAVRIKLLEDYPMRLKAQEVTNVFYPEPEYDENDYRLVAKDTTLKDMLNAFELIVERRVVKDSTPASRTIRKERFSVSDKVLEFTRALRERKRICFSELFAPDFAPGDFLTAFLAILELLRIQIATGEQAKPYSDIILEYNEERANDIDEGELIGDVDEYN